MHASSTKFASSSNVRQMKQPAQPAPIPQELDPEEHSSWKAHIIPEIHIIPP
jgi:hypothetical protein